MQTSRLRGARAAGAAGPRVGRAALSRRLVVIKAETATNATKPLKVMISGAPAAGKGTQCEKIVEKYNLVHISAGDLLREQVAKGTPAGLKAKDFMEQGVLVPDDVIVEMIKSRLGQEDCQAKGWLLDGYPRSPSQADAIEKEGIRPDLFLLIEVPSDLLVERVVGRRMDPETGSIYHLKYKPPPPAVVDRLVQRSDDTEEKVKTRLEVHFKNVNSVLGYYKDCCVEIDGNRSIDAVFSNVCQAINECKAKLGDPLEEFCVNNPSDVECKVFDE